MLNWAAVLETGPAGKSQNGKIFKNIGALKVK